MPIPRLSTRLALISCLIVASGLIAGGVAVAHGQQHSRRKLTTDYRIFKMYSRFVQAISVSHAAQSNRANTLVLRYGNRNWGLDHLKAKHGWGRSLDNSIQTIVSDPKTHVRAEGGGTYRWDDQQWIGGELCPFRVVENRNALRDGYEKGIITAYALAPCGIVFL